MAVAADQPTGRFDAKWRIGASIIASVVMANSLLPPVPVTVRQLVF